MGGASSVPANASLSTDQAALVKLILPIYYCEDAIDAEEVKQAQAAWDHILNDSGMLYLTKKAHDPAFGEEHPSCVTFFTTFYGRLFDVHPASKGMFTAGLKSQGKFLVQLMTLALTLVLNNEKLEKVLTSLAEKHNERGVKAYEYGIVGEVLFWSLRTVLGEEVFNARVYFIFTKIFSRMLKVMVPCALAWELQTLSGKQQTAQVKRHLALEDSLKRKISHIDATEAASKIAATGKTRTASDDA